MNGLEVTVLVGITVLTGAILAPRLRVAVPLLLVVAGLALGFIPEVREIELPPETVLLLFLPVLLFWESLTTSLRSIRRDFRGIFLMSTALVVASAFAVAGIAYLLGLPWDAALILGAAVAPTDATAVAALGRMLPRRNFMNLKAESLTNDGTALVIYGVAVGVAVGGTYTPLDVTGLVALSYVGGAAAGIVVAGLAYLVMRRTRNTLNLNIALLLVPFTAFLVAELIHASGVLAVVVAGLIIAYIQPRISTAASRRQAAWTWPLGSFLLNGSLFVLIGFEVQAVAHEIPGREIGWLAAMTVAVWLVLLVARFVFQTTSVMIIRLLDRRPSQRLRRTTYRARIVSAVAGFRGAVSLAIALSVPLTTASGEALPGRDEIIFVTAGVILLTLLVQGPLLPTVVRWARLPDDMAMQKELELAERAITGAALTAVKEIALDHGISEETRDRLTRDYYEFLERNNERAQAREQAEVDRQIADLDRRIGETGDAVPDPATAAGLSRAGAERPEAAAEEASATATALLEAPAPLPSPRERDEEYSRLRIAVLDRKREVLYRLRREGAVDDAVVTQIQTRLDVEELRITGIETLD
ncbi:CPA1 family monovalent cation:H+ antiporter [Microbacterium trichothecenolyticum]|uniref:Na+/H+ antiporter n=1 Tax=Microbacterium trichothecenolyticum TaxID=69370 RepID=UPI0028576C68|nr:Na+/H+ antiporter [Microbacterium trichothecenolyticum]MDR7111212.1 CPA1 family monovalent cation:H+ antiporter [Microbacterium trichothecenolyticum]